MEDLQEEGCPEGVGNLTEASHWTIHTEILGEEDPSAVVHQAEVSAAWALRETVDVLHTICTNRQTEASLVAVRPPTEARLPEDHPLGGYPLADPLPGMTGTEEVIPLGRDALQTWIPEEEDPP